MTPYFDYKDIDSPIKYHVDDSYLMVFNVELFHTMDMYVRKNEYTLHDNVFLSSESDKRVFYNIEKSNANTLISDGTYLGFISFKLDYQIDQYYRNVGTVITAIGTIGGNYEILYIFLRLILNVYAAKVFRYSINNFSMLEDKNQDDRAEINDTHTIQSSKNN